MNANNNEETKIDLLKLLLACWHRLWIIVLAAVVCAGIGFSYAKFMITPEYQSGIMVYVNNNAHTTENTAITPGDLSVSQQLVDTYVVILKNKSTLKEIIEAGNLNYTPAQLGKMISASAVNETEIFQINVTGTKQTETALIANTIAEVLPEKISSIVEGSSVRIMDTADVPLRPISPSVTKYTALGLLLGIVVSAFAIIVIELFNTTIRDEEYLTQTYNLPVLAVIPELTSNKSSRSNYYAGNHQKKEKEDEE